MSYVKPKFESSLGTIEIGREKLKKKFLICFMLIAWEAIIQYKRYLSHRHSLLRHNHAMFTRDVALP